LPQRELAALYARAAVYALPARYEPFGLSVLEAAHAGCALVLGDIPSLRETWDGAALFVPPDDCAALRRALLRLCADASLRDLLSAIARDRAAAFTPERMAAAYAESYAAAAGARREEQSVPCAS
jgi:glycosyltransferase involved in cell wall biosynthesis